MDIVTKCLGLDAPKFFDFIQNNIELIDEGNIEKLYAACPPAFFNMAVIIMMESKCIFDDHETELPKHYYYRLSRTLDYMFCVTSKHHPYICGYKEALKLKNYCLFKSLKAYAKFLYAAYKDGYNCAILFPEKIRMYSDTELVNTKYGDCLVIYDK